MPLRDAFVQLPDQYDSLVQKYATLLKKINTTECFDAKVPDMKQFFLKKVDSLKEVFDDKTYTRVKNVLENVPDRNTFIHGDCHFKNIMCQGDELLLIDMDTLSMGHPIFELARLRAPYLCFEEIMPGNSETFFKINADLVSKIYHDLIKNYFGDTNQEIEDKIALMSYIHMVLWLAKNTPENKDGLAKAYQRLQEYLDKVKDLDLGL